MFVCSECGAPQPTPGHCPADGTALAAIGEDVLLGTTIGAYRVARLLGIGGMGRVYKGVHPSIGSRVAIKVLSRECSDRRDLVERFFAEAKAVNLIRHESIVNVLDLAMLPDGRPYIIMEYLDGAPLASIVEHAIHTRQPLPLGGLARLAVEVLDALGAAHAKGIVHRDLKPDNIFVTPSGRPKVLDFGIAKLSDTGGLGSATRTGSLLGTPHYMSPEQAAGKVVDHRADIYAIGVILFECATGAKPFVADSLFDLLRKHVEAPPPSPRGYRADITPELDSVILAALAKPPDQRFASAHAMSMALQHATAQLPQDQWTPILGSGTHRAQPSGGWQPTPPASWGGQRSVPRPSEQPLPQPAPIPHHSTVSSSSGQVVPPRRPGSARGLWIAIAAVVVIGGGITAAAVVGGGDAPASAGETTAAAGSAATPPGEQPAAPATGSAGSGSGKAAPAAKAERDDGDDSDDGDDEPGGDDEKLIKELTKDLPDDVAAQVGDALEQMPPEMRKQMQELADLGKLTPAQRKARLRALRKQIDDATADGATRAGGAGTPAAVATTPPAASGDWIEAHPLAPPPGWDPKRVDVGAFISYAIAEARKAIPDAKLIRIDVSGVSPDGRANIHLPTLASDHGDIELRFISPSRSKRDPKAPIGVPVEWKCEFRIEGEPDGVWIRPIDGWDCSKETPIPPPKCTAAGVWKLAILAKAPASNAVGNLGYRGWAGKARWYFDIGFGHDVVFSQVFPDGC